VRFCEVCDCQACDDFPGEAGNESWSCPLLGGNNICDTCCQVELAGGMGAPDTLETMGKKAKKTPQEVHAICVRCRHGGKKLDEMPVAIYKRPGTEADASFEDGWRQRLLWLQGKREKLV